MSDDKYPSKHAPAPSQMEALLSQLVAAQVETGKALSVLAGRQPVPEATPPTEPEPLAEEHKGTKTYRINAPHYRAGVLYSVGDAITVTDEKPSKTWDLISGTKKVEPVKAAVLKRPSALDAEL